MSEKWKSHNLPEGRIDIFIGILSATNHFAERMAIRKSWMQSDSIKSSKIMARFFVALVSKFNPHILKLQIHIEYSILYCNEINVFFDVP